MKEYYIAYDRSRLGLPLGTFESIEKMEKELSGKAYIFRKFKDTEKREAEKLERYTKLPYLVRRIVDIKQNRDVSFTEIAEEIGVPRREIYDWTAGKRKPNLKRQKMILVWLNGKEKTK